MVEVCDIPMHFYLCAVVYSNINWVGNFLLSPFFKNEKISWDFWLRRLKNFSRCSLTFFDLTFYYFWYCNPEKYPQLTNFAKTFSQSTQYSDNVLFRRTRPKFPRTHFLQNTSGGCFWLFKCLWNLDCLSSDKDN